MRAQSECTGAFVCFRIYPALLNSQFVSGCSIISRLTQRVCGCCGVDSTNKKQGGQSAVSAGQWGWAASCSANCCGVSGTLSGRPASQPPPPEWMLLCEKMMKADEMKFICLVSYYLITQTSLLTNAHIFLYLQLCSNFTSPNSKTATRFKEIEGWDDF